jgi:hypothetical protein
MSGLYEKDTEHAKSYEILQICMDFHQRFNRLGGYMLFSLLHLWDELVVARSTVVAIIQTT